MNPRLQTTNNAHEFPILLAYKYFFLFTWILSPFFDFALEREALEFNYLCFFSKIWLLKRVLDNIL